MSRNNKMTASNKDTQLATSTDAIALQTLSPDEIKAILEGPGKLDPLVVSLSEDGQAVTGTVIGPGFDVEVNQMDSDGTRRVEQVATCLMDVGNNVEIALMLSHQIKALPQRVGQRLFVCRIGTDETRLGRRVTRYVVKELAQ